MSQAAILPSALRPGIVADLHTHSTCSDGRLSPEAIIDRALALGLRGLSITDHDNLAGSTRAAAYLRTLRESGSVPEDFIFVPGIELSTSTEGRDVHLLVYWPRSTGRELAGLLADAEERRRERALRIVDLLAEDGWPVSRESFLATGLKPNRPNVARVLIESGRAPSVDWCFGHLFNDGCPYHVPRFEVDTCEAIRVALRAGGVPVVAHPAHYRCEQWIERFSRAGLEGVAAWHSLQTAQDATRLIAVARRLGLAVSGGSDWHGDTVHSATLGGVGLTAPEFSEFLKLKPQE